MLIRSLFITFLRTHLYAILAWKFSSHPMLVCVPAGQTHPKPSKILISILFKSAANCKSFLITAVHKLNRENTPGAPKRLITLWHPNTKEIMWKRKQQQLNAPPPCHLPVSEGR